MFLESIFSKYFAQTEEFEQSLLAPFEKSVTESLNKLKIQLANDEKQQQTLKK